MVLFENIKNKIEDYWIRNPVFISDNEFYMNNENDIKIVYIPKKIDDITDLIDKHEKLLEESTN